MTPPQRIDPPPGFERLAAHGQPAPRARRAPRRTDRPDGRPEDPQGHRRRSGHRGRLHPGRARQGDRPGPGVRSPTSSASWAGGGPGRHRGRAAAAAVRRYSWPRGAGIVAGVDFGHSHVAVAIGDLAGRGARRGRAPRPRGHPTDHDPRRSPRPPPCSPVIVGMGQRWRPAVTWGSVCRRRSTRRSSALSAILPVGLGVNARARRRGDPSQAPVHVENDAANLGALAEHRRGRRPRPQAGSVFVKISSGVGARDHHRQRAVPRRRGHVRARSAT